MWPWLVLATLVVGAAGGAAFILLRPGGAPAAQPAPSPTVSPLRDAWDDCGSAGALRDDDTTLVLDMEGDDLGSGDLSFSDIACVLDQLGAPSYVTEAMERTRALDGVQRETWDQYEASWTYHPDQGLDIIIRQV